MREFTEALRYDYLLTRSSIVIDAGAYEGTFSNLILEKYECRVFAFEPVKTFYQQCISRFQESPYRDKIKLYNYALGGQSRADRIFIRGDATGLYTSSSAIPEAISVLGVSEALTLIGDFPTIDLFKINVEGSEYEILESIISKNLANKFTNLQVQFHTVATGHEERYKFIANELSKTHELTYCSPYVWENWKRR